MILGMKTSNEYEKIGTRGLVIIGLILGVFLVVKKYETFQREKIYYIRSSSEDLNQDDIVLFNNYEAGKISKIELLPKSPKILYEFRLAKRFRIPETANYYISFDTLREQNQLEIMTTLRDQPPLFINPGDTIEGKIRRSH